MDYFRYLRLELSDTFWALLSVPDITIFIKPVSFIGLLLWTDIDNYTCIYGKYHTGYDYGISYNDFDHHGYCFDYVLLEGLILNFCLFRAELVDFHKATGHDGTHPRMFTWIHKYYNKGDNSGEPPPPLFLQHQGKLMFIDISGSLETN